MFISKFSIKRPVTIVMIVFIIIILGFVSFTRLKTDLFPSINFPVAAVSTTYMGASPEEVESIVSKNIENAVSSVSNVKTVSSISFESNSLIIVEFESNANMDAAVLEMRERIDLFSSFLPEDVSDPMIIKFNPNMMPIMGIAATKSNKTMAELTEFIEKTVVPRLERIEGVGAVSLMGGSTKEVHILIDQEKLVEYGVTLDMISGLLQAQSFNMPLGLITDDGTDYLVRSIGAMESVEDIENLQLGSMEKGLFKLKDIATIEFAEVESRNYSKVNGENSLTISIQRQSEYNTTEVAKKVNSELDNIKNDYPDISLISIFDQSLYINKMVSNVSTNALIGALLAILILILFLRDLRPTFIIGVAIPISVVAAFILIHFAGITINAISLGGLALGIGMLVDNSIVVLENIYRMRKEGKPLTEAAIEGASQVSGAIIASTLTTVSVFLPVVFVQGITAQLFKEMALTVSMSLLASLFIALTLVPMMSSKLLKDLKKVDKNSFFEKVKRVYTRMLAFSLKHRLIVISLSLVIFVLSIVGAFSMGAQFFPESDQGQITIDLTMPKGSTFNKTVEVVSQIEDRVSDIREIETVSARVSGSASGFMAFMNSGANVGTVNIVLVSKASRSRDSEEISASIRSRLSDLPGDIQVSSQSSNFMAFGSSAPILVEIKGQNFIELETISNDIQDILTEIKGAINIETSIQKGSPELRISLIPSLATPMGLTNFQVASIVSEAISGVKVSTITIDNKDIAVKFIDIDNIDLEIDSLKNLSLFSTTLNKDVPLSSIASVETADGYSRIERQNGSRLVTVSSSLDGSVTTRDAAKKLEEKLDSYELPEGYSINISGENEQIIEAFGDLYLALVLAVVLIYMVMAAQFESFLHPFIIMFSIPLAFSGAFLGLLITGTPLSVPALIGVIVLAGIVVNNGIVLIDYINKLRNKGLSKLEAIMEAGPVRLRPILMTAFTTILALIPLALGLGEGSELEAPLAIAAVGGLLFSTLLTLILLPVVYSLLESVKKRTKKSKADV